MANKRASNEGTVRKRADGRWEARYTAGVDAGTGKQVQRSVYGKTQKEVVTKLKAILSDIEQGIYTNPSKLTVGGWLDIWLKEYTGDVAESTLPTYEVSIRCHIKPYIGAVRLMNLRAIQIQDMINQMKDTLSAKTIKNTYGVLHRALEQAVKLEYIRVNPCNSVTIPKVVKPPITVLGDSEIVAFLKVLQGTQFYALCKFAIFTGMRAGEILGLTWDRIDFEKGTILIDRQLMREKKKGGGYKFVPPKMGKTRKIKPAPLVMDLLRDRKKEQAIQKLRVGDQWNTEGFDDLVFTDAFGKHFGVSTPVHVASRAAQKIGIQDFCFHDLRHTYAVASIRAGEDFKTISENLGHSSVAFTMDVYASFTDDMRDESSKRMQRYADSIGV